MKRWINYLKLNSGFSLVEAIVSVVILGIAIVPISMVFSQSVGTTISTREQLEGTKIAQYYMENMKNMDTSELPTFLPGGTKTFDSATDMSTTPDIDKVPDGFRVIMSYETDVDLGDYALPSPNAMAPVDAIVKIESGYAAAVKIGATELPTGAVSNARTILIKARRSSLEAEISYIDDAAPNTNNGVVSNIPLVNKAIRFEMGDDSTGTLYTTTIVVDSDLEDPLNIYIYEDEKNTVNATTKITAGICSFSRNLLEVSGVQHRILETRVEVYNTYTNKLVASLTSTAINE